MAADLTRAAVQPSRWSVRSLLRRIDVVAGLAPCLLAVAILAIWQAVSAAGIVSPLALPAPVDIAEAAVAQRQDLASATWVTVAELLIALVTGTVVGVAAGLLVAHSARARAAIYPYLVAIQAAPKIAIAPIVLLWAGTGLATPVTMGFIMVVFPVLVAAEQGFASVHHELHELATSLRASAWLRFRKISLPNAIPSIVSGVKIAIAQGLTGVIVAEFVQEHSGLGFVILKASSRGQTTIAFAVIALLGLIALVFVGLVALWETLDDKWAREYSNS